MHMNAALRRAAATRSRDVAIVDQGRHRTWAETLDRVARRAGALRQSGVAPGSHVALLCLNSAAYLETLLAVWWAGGVLVPVNTRLAADEVRFIADHGEVTVFLTDPAMNDLGARLSRELPRRPVHLVLQDEPDRVEPMDAEDVDPSSLAGIFYTGGTTGQPKGVALTHDNFLFTALTMQREMGMDGGTVYQHAAPLFHLADFTIGLGVMLAGGAHTFMSRFSTAGFYDQLRDDGVTHLQLVPTMLAQVLDAPERDDAAWARVRSVSYGAAPISEALLRRLMAAVPQARIQQFYGMTECCGANVTLPSERHVLEGPLAGKLRSAGQVIAGYELRVVDSALRPCAPGIAGEVLVRGPGVMKGYWRDEVRTREAFVDGWLRSGDMGVLDEDGFVSIVDRLKDMIISGGENIYGAEVENALATHPAVAACAVIGIPDDHWGERVHAVIVLREEGSKAPTPQDLEQHCRERIAGF
jgi:long-chain acyl-CoA synthetase